MLLVLVAALSSVFGQDLTLECSFADNWDGYTCVLANIEVLDPDQNVVFTGEHLEDRTDDDVHIVRVTNSNTPFVIPQIFSTFSNVKILNIFTSHLEAINLPESAFLDEIYIQGNNISVIENETFSGQTNLTYLNLRNNTIEEIEEDAFVGLEALESLVLIANNIQTLARRTLHPLTNVRYVDFERNNLTRIDEEIFSRNTLVSTLYLEYNQISEITPRFIQNFSDSLTYINLSGNVCVDRTFSVNREDVFGRIVINNALRNCFNNFVGTVPEVRHITLEFQGPLRLFDEFGNLIANVPE